MKTPRSVHEKTDYQSCVSLPYIGLASHKIERILKEVGNQVYHSSEANCFDLFAHIRIKLMNFRNLVCTVFFVNVVWFTCIGETGRNL